MSNSASATFCIVTPSYRNDRDLAASLCQSVDRYLPKDIRHYLIVPDNDLACFADLASERRTILSKDNILRPFGFRRLPLPGRIYIPGILDKKIKEKWWSPARRIVGGWLVQQIIKLAIPSFIENEAVLIVDSDVCFIQKFDPEKLWEENLLYLYEHTQGIDNETHRKWRATARSLLGVLSGDIAPKNYIGGITIWRRGSIIELQHRIGEQMKMPWFRAATLTNDFSECIAYGTYCRAIGTQESGHHVSDVPLARSIWVCGNELSIEDVTKGMTCDTVAVHIQSTMPVSPEKRAAIVAACECAELKEGAR